MTAQSTVKKSHASIVAAWVGTNCRQVELEHCGGGGIRSRFSTRRTVDAPTRMPKPGSSPWIRLYPQPGFSRATAEGVHGREYFGPDGPGEMCGLHPQAGAVLRGRP